MGVVAKVADRVAVMNQGKIVEQGPVREYIDKRIPGRRPGTAEEVARLVAALFAEDLAFLSGETIYIDGGQGIAH